MEDFYPLRIKSKFWPLHPHKKLDHLLNVWMLAQGCYPFSFWALSQGFCIVLPSFKILMVERQVLEYFHQIFKFRVHFFINPCRLLLFLSLEFVKFFFSAAVLNWFKTLLLLCNRKLRALARASPYMNLQKKNLMNAFFNAQFNYCPLIWMLHSRQNNNKIKLIYERCLRLFHNNKLYWYEELGSVSIHHKNIQILSIEMFQIKHGQSPETARDIFAQTTQL